MCAMHVCFIFIFPVLGGAEVGPSVAGQAA